MFDAKIAGEEFIVHETEAPAKVVDLMAALRKNLDSVSESKRSRRNPLPPARPPRPNANAPDPGPWGRIGGQNGNFILTSVLSPTPRAAS